MTPSSAPVSAEVRPAEIRVWRDVDARLFHETIAPLGRPAVLKGLVADWPAVRAAGDPAALAALIGGFSNDQPVRTLHVGPQAKGWFFYNDDLSAFNFEAAQRPLRAVLDQLVASLAAPDGSATAAQFVPVRAVLPGFEAANRNPLLDGSVAPNIWVGDRVVVSAHFDLFENIACVVGGRRRFTLFPPEQVANLYVGPFELTPAGVPVSLVDFDNPDLERHPRFTEALAAAEVADLEPGDAIYIPYLWWHHVRSLEGFNVLVNYWWNRTEPGVAPPMMALMLALLALRDLPPAYREAWRGLFDHWVFQANGPPMDHLPAERRGGLAATSPQLRRLMTANILRTLGGAP